ncbi:MAG: hypothetical protein ACYDB4_16340 [Candidatus Dormibacteraceae bacterium]
MRAATAGQAYGIPVSFSVFFKRTWGRSARALAIAGIDRAALLSSTRQAE